MKETSEISFSFQRMGTNNRFKREAKTNLEMAYSRPFAIFIAQHKTRTVNIFPASFTSKWLWQRAFSLYQGSIALLLELKITCQCKTTIENLSNDDKDQRTTPNKTRIYILPSNFLIVYICSESLLVSSWNWQYICVRRLIGLRTCLS